MVTLGVMVALVATRVTARCPMSTGVKDVEQVQAATKEATMGRIEMGVVDTRPQRLTFQRPRFQRPRFQRPRSQRLTFQHPRSHRQQINVGRAVGVQVMDVLTSKAMAN